MTHIKEGHGFYVGQDFGRTVKNTPFEVQDQRGCWIYGWITGDPQSKLGFMRSARVLVRTRTDCVVQS